MMSASAGGRAQAGCGGPRRRPVVFIAMEIPSKDKFPHIQQQFNWDCGIVSCQMCLHWCGMVESFENLTRLCPTKSTWSIDLVYLLHKIGMKVNSGILFSFLSIFEMTFLPLIVVI